MKYHVSTSARAALRFVAMLALGTTIIVPVAGGRVPLAGADDTSTSSGAGTTGALPFVDHPTQPANVPAPAGLLPRGRGTPQSTLLNPGSLTLPLTTDDVLKTLNGLVTVPSVSLPTTDLSAVAVPSGVSLPTLDLSSVTDTVSRTLNQVQQLVNGATTTVTQLALGVVRANSTTTSSTTALATPSATWHLHTVASGYTGDFDIALCQPANIDLTSSNVLTPTTIVSLCPVPLGLASTKLLPPPGQPAQLYLSIDRIPGTAVVPATFRATYTVPATPTTSAIPLYFDLDNTAHAYPASAVVGAVTDFDPTSSTTKKDATFSWSLTDLADVILGGVSGVGEIEVDAIPSGAGTMTETAQDSRLTSQLANKDPLPAGSNPLVKLRGPISSTVGTSEGRLTWTHVPQDFTFDLNVTHQDFSTKTALTGISFNGNQAPSANTAFGAQMDVLTNGALVGRYTQSGFGAQFSNDTRFIPDLDGNIAGVDIQTTPGATSTVAMSGYNAGVLAQFVELVGLRPDASEFRLDLDGTTGVASAGATLTGTNQSAFIGAGSYLVPGSGGGALASTMVNAIAMYPASGATSSGAPFPMAAGSKLNAVLTGVSSEFKVVLKSLAAGTVNHAGAAGFEVSGTSSTGFTARQLTIDADSDGTHRAHVLFNQLGQDFKFSANLHGDTANAKGIDVTDNNTPAMPTEYKQILVSGLVSGSWVTQYSFEIKHPSSDLTGSQANAGVIASLSDPPPSFTMTIDYAPTTSASGTTQALNIKGTDQSPSGGSITLQAGAISASIQHEFVQGDWQVQVTHNATADDPNSLVLHAHQGLGANASGFISVSSANAASASLTSFATTTDVTVKQLVGTDKATTGAQITGGNSEANPGEQLHIDVFNNSATTAVAVNVYSGSPVGVHSGSVGTVVVSGIPQTFGVTVERRPTPDGQQELHLETANQTDAPSERITVDAPAGTALPGGHIHAELRHPDATSVVRLSVGPTAGGGQTAHVFSNNKNPNPAEVLTASLSNSAGGLVHLLLFSGPSGDLSGIATNASGVVLNWTNMPNDYNLTIRFTTQDGAAEMGVTISGSEETPASTLSMSTPVAATPATHATTAHVVLTGTGAQQYLDIFPGGGGIEVKGDMPPSFKNAEVYTMNGTPEDKVFFVERGANPPPVSTSTYGTDIRYYAVANQTAYDLTLGMSSGNTVTIDSFSDVPGGFLDFYQYYQGMAWSNPRPCYSGDPNTPVTCISVSLSTIPQQMQLMVTPSTESNALPTITYHATDSLLQIFAQTLQDGLGATIMLNGMPKGGMHTEGTLDMTGSGATIVIGVDDPSDVLPSAYIDGFNVVIPVAIASGTRSFYIKDGLKVDLDVQMFFHYVGLVAMSWDQGLKQVELASAKTGDNDGGAFVGLLGLRVDGPSADHFNLGVSLALVTDTVQATESWSWSVYESIGGIGIDSDSDAFQWGPLDNLNYAAGTIEFNSWQVFSGTTQRYEGAGCDDTTTSSTIDTTPYVHQTGITPPFPLNFTQTYNGLSACGGSRTYYQLNLQGLLAEHCTGNPAPCPTTEQNTTASTRYSYASGFGYTTDWLLAVLMKEMYSYDPLKFTTMP
jgi:hypothetical protein